MNGGDQNGDWRVHWLPSICLHLSGSQIGLRVKVSFVFYFTDGEILEYIKIFPVHNF